MLSDKEGCACSRGHGVQATGNERAAARARDGRHARTSRSPDGVKAAHPWHSPDDQHTVRPKRPPYSLPLPPYFSCIMSQVP